MIKIKNLFCASYFLLILLFIDSRFTTPIFGKYKLYYNLYEIFFIVVWSIAYIVGKLNTTKIKVTNSGLCFCVLMVLISFSAATTSTSLIYTSESHEVRNIVEFCILVFLCTWWIERLKCRNFFIVSSYAVMSGMIFNAYVKAGMPIEILTRLGTVFSSTDRYRLSFGYYQVNGLGNLCVCAIILSCFCWTIIKRHGYTEKLLKLLIIFLDSVVVIVLLSTGSRSSIMMAGIYLLLLIYNGIGNLETISFKWKLCFKLLCVIFALATITFGLWQQLTTLFVDSNRLKNFSINLPLLKNSGRTLIGLGLVDPGIFGSKMTIYGASYYIDNYYLYLVVEMGIIGLISMIGILIFIGTKIFSDKERENRALVGSCFLAQLVTGMAETNVFYYIFPSCLIYWILYMLACDGGPTIKLERGCKK